MTDREKPLCVWCRRHPADPAWRPFCSERCKTIDLGDWASERYRVPTGEEVKDAPEAEGENKDPGAKRR